MITRAIKSVGIAVGLLAGLITSAIGIGTMSGWLSAPAAVLSATVQFVPYEYPPERRKTEESITARLDDRYDHMFVINITNRGDLKSTDVSLRVPNAEMARIYGRAGAEDRRVNEVIDIGDVGPDERVRVVAWPNRFSFSFPVKDVTLRHSQGVGTVTKYAPVGPFWQWLASYWGLLPISLLIMLFSIGFVRTFAPTVSAPSTPGRSAQKRRKEE